MNWVSFGWGCLAMFLVYTGFLMWVAWGLPMPHMLRAICRAALLAVMEER